MSACYARPQLPRRVTSPCELTVVSTPASSPPRRGGTPGTVQASVILPTPARQRPCNSARWLPELWNCLQYCRTNAPKAPERINTFSMRPRTLAAGACLLLHAISAGERPFLVTAAVLVALLVLGTSFLSSCRADLCTTLGARLLTSATITSAFCRLASPALSVHRATASCRSFSIQLGQRADLLLAQWHQAGRLACLPDLQAPLSARSC